MKENEQLHQEMGQRIADLRKRQGLTQTDLAEKLGKTQKSVASYEAGRNAVPIAILAPMAEILKVAIEDLLNSKPNKMKPGPASKLHRQISEVENLPQKKKKLVSDFLDTILKS